MRLVMPLRISGGAIELMPKSDIKAAGLVRGLGVWSATAIVIGSIIGTAIFLVPPKILSANKLSSANFALG